MDSPRVLDTQKISTVAERILILRRRHRWTQKDLSKHCIQEKVSESTIRAVELGAETLKMSTLGAIADALGVQVQKLYDPID